MLVFVACIKHPDKSQSYDDVWKLLNNTLYSVCNQTNQEFRVIVVCDKKLPLFHHQKLINKYTDFIEVDFPSHSRDILENFERLGNLSPRWADASWWLRWEDADFTNGEPDGYFHIANVFLNMGTKLIVGILAAGKYDPDYVAIFDGDDYIGNDIAAYSNAHPGKNGWLMTHGYKLAGNQIAPIYAKNSFCGTGNIIRYPLLKNFIGENVTEKSTQNELFEHVNSEFLITLANHKKIKPYFEKQGVPLLEFPTRSVLYQVAHAESSEHAMKILRGKSTQRFKQTKKFGKIRHLPAPLIDYFNILASNQPKVFCLGFHKTGTTSLEILLQDMGYQVASPYKNWDPKLTKMLEAGNLDELKGLTEKFDAFQDAPWFLFYKEFDQWYPGSKFILTVRDSCSWWKSFANYFKDEHRPLFKYMYGFDNPVGHENVFIKHFEDHNRKVINYFKNRPSDLLVIDISDSDALQKTTAFLNRTTSCTSMPHKNASLREPDRNILKSYLKRVKEIKKTTWKNRLAFVIKKTSFASPIIIGGSKASGTEFLLAMLSGHQNLHTLPNIKLAQFNRHPLVSDRNSFQNYRHRKKAHPIDIYHLNYVLLKRRISFSAKRWVSTNRLSILAYEELLNYYGKGLRILNIVRDGRDIVIENDAKILGRYAVPCERWVYDVKEGIKFENHPQVLTIHYEDLIQAPEGAIQEIANFIGETNFQPFLQYPKKAKMVESGYWIGKWKQPQYTERINELYQTPEAKECLQHYGYLEQERSFFHGE
jgi:hypothetical protein